MAKKTYLPEQIINKLCEAEILLNQWATIAEASRKIGVTKQPYTDRIGSPSCSIDRTFRAEFAFV